MARYQPELCNPDEIFYDENDIHRMYEEDGGEETGTFEEYVNTLFVMVTPDGLYQESESLRRTRDWHFGEVYSNLTIYC